MSQLLFFAGSARKDSFNKKLAKAACDMAIEQGFDAKFIDLADYPMPIYDGDDEAAGGIPEAAKRLRDELKAAKGLFIASPEYNSSFPPLLKNIIDWCSRPDGDDNPMLAAFAGKTAVVVSASPGGFGGMRGLVPLRMLLGNIGITVLPNTLSVSAVHEAMNESGEITNDGHKMGIHFAVQALGNACK